MFFSLLIAVSYCGVLVVYFGDTREAESLALDGIKRLNGGKISCRMFSEEMGNLTNLRFGLDLVGNFIQWLKSFTNNFRDFHHGKASLNPSLARELQSSFTITPIRQHKTNSLAFNQRTFRTLFSRCNDCLLARFDALIDSPVNTQLA
jgi:hypothetical protein